MGTVQHFQQLETWQESHKLVLMVYQITKGFPSDERYGLISQMRRAAVSIPANVAEGFKRRGIRDKIHFYNISEGPWKSSSISSSYHKIWTTSHPRMT
jgi:hypothetical protein